MEKVNRLGWTDGLSFEAYGTRFGIRTNDAAVLDQVQERLPLGWQPEPEPLVDLLYSLRVGPPSKRTGRRNFNLLYMGAGRIARSLELEEILAELEYNLEAVTPFVAQGALFLRAGAVGWQGQAILLPGHDAGTTTLVTALLRAGASYYGDSYAILDPEGRVHPYPTPLMVRDESGEKADKVAVELLGGAPGQDPLPVGMIAWSTYEAGARWQPRALSPGRAVLTLLQHTPAGRNAEFALPILRQAATGATLIKSKRPEAGATAEALLALLEENQKKVTVT